MGELEGVTIQVMRDDWPDLYSGWREDASSVTMPNGESLGDVQKRAMAALDEMDATHPGDETVVAVTHNFTIRCIVAAVIGLPLANINHMDLALGSRTAINFGPRVGGWSATRGGSPVGVEPDALLRDGSIGQS